MRREEGGTGEARGGGAPVPHPSGESPLHLRPARPADLPEILEIEGRSFSTPWSPAVFRDLLERDRVAFLVAESGGMVRGYGVLWWTLDEGELANLSVAPEARRGGVARRLLAALLKEAAEAGVLHVFLEVRESNEGAIALYRGAGFHQVGVRRRYYTAPTEDAQIMTRELESGEWGGWTTDSTAGNI